MSNYTVYKENVAFHPGYYIKELIDESGLTQEDFAKRLDTTPKNISKLINAEQNLSREMAFKLSRMLGTTVDFWINLQSGYDSKMAEFMQDEEMEKEKEVYQYLDYSYFKENYEMPDGISKVDEQIDEIRHFLNVASLTVLKNRNLAVDFKSYANETNISNVISSNTMAQIAINEALKKETSKFDRKKFAKAVEYALSLSEDQGDFYSKMEDAFRKAGVALVVLPDLPSSNVEGVTKKLGSKIMLMINDKKAYSDTFWYTLFHEIGNINMCEYGITFDDETKRKPDVSDMYAEDMLIPKDRYNDFIQKGDFCELSIRKFAREIQRDPGIVLGRLERDGLINDTNEELRKTFRKRYRIKTA